MKLLKGLFSQREDGTASVAATAAGSRLERLADTIKSDLDACSVPKRVATASSSGIASHDHDKDKGIRLPVPSAFRDVVVKEQHTECEEARKTVQKESTSEFDEVLKELDQIRDDYANMFPDLKTFVSFRRLGCWLEKYATKYVSASRRRHFVKIVSCENVSAGKQCMVRLVFQVKIPGLKTYQVRVRDVYYSTVEEVDGQVFNIHKHVATRGTHDQLSAVNASRYHILRTITKMRGYLEDGALIPSPYISGCRKQLDVARRCDSSIKRDARRAADDPIKSSRPDPWFKRMAMRFGIDSDSETELELAGRNTRRDKILNSLSDDEFDRVSRETALKELRIVAEKCQKEAGKRFELIEAMKAKREETSLAVVSSEVPCFRTVNSSIKMVAGYARVQIGGAYEASGRDRGVKYFTDKTTIAELSEALTKHCEDLKDKYIYDVLLSGNCWTPDCKLDGAVLNAHLPKCFDGMHVKVVASARYGLAVARKVQEFWCDEDQPYDPDEMRTFEPDEDMPGELEEGTVTCPTLTLDYADKPDIELLSIYYYDTYPESATVDQDLKQLDFHSAPQDIEMPLINFHTNEAEEFDERVFEDRGYMVPSLQTHIEPRHPINQNELMYSVSSRNYAVPKEDTTIDSILAASQLFNAFSSQLKRQPEPLTVAVNEISDYIQHKGGDLVRNLNAEIAEAIPRAVDRWSALVKGSPKPELSDEGADKYSPTQVIICKEKLYNARFGPWASKIKERIHLDLNDNVFIFSELSIDGLQQKLTRKAKHIKEGDTRLELDMSKYDKSQGLTALLLDVMIFKAYGMPDELVDYWVDSHWYTYVKSMVGQTSFALPAQRKSGDPWTYYGNTFYLLSTLISTVRDGGKYNVNFIMVSGDDSLLWGDFPQEHSATVVEMLLRDYSLDAKVIKASSMYFCSRFIVILEDFWFMVPDPVKIMIKLGKKDVRDRGHMAEIRLALLDQLETYRYVEIRDAMDEITSDRYSMPCIGELMSHIYALARDVECFSKLYGETDSAKHMCIIVPETANIPVSTRTVEHFRLIKKAVRRLHTPELNSYMRAIGQNCGKRILLTYSYDFVPQNTRVIADFTQTPYSIQALNDVVRRHYRD